MSWLLRIGAPSASPVPAAMNPSGCLLQTSCSCDTIQAVPRPPILSKIPGGGELWRHHGVSKAAECSAVGK